MPIQTEQPRKRAASDAHRTGHSEFCEHKQQPREGPDRSTKKASANIRDIPNIFVRFPINLELFQIKNLKISHSN